MVTLGLDLQRAHTNGIDLEDPIDHPGIKLLMRLIMSGGAHPRPEGTCVLYTARTGTLFADEYPPRCLLNPDHMRHVVCGLMPRHMLQEVVATGATDAASSPLGKESRILEAAAAGGHSGSRQARNEGGTVTAAAAVGHGMSGVDLIDTTLDDNSHFIHPRLLGGEEAAALAVGASEPDASTYFSSLPAAIRRRFETLDEKKKDEAMHHLASLDFAAASCGIMQEHPHSCGDSFFARVPTCAVPLRE